jgi:peptidyl-prolyl cis-trans isomerase D
VEVKPADGKPAPKADAAGDYAAARTLVESTLKFERAQKLALKAASDVAVAVDEAVVDQRPAVPRSSRRSSPSRQLKLKPLAPFTREAGPAELGGSPDIANEAFKLGKAQTAMRPRPLPPRAVPLILVWKDSLPGPQTPVHRGARQGFRGLPRERKAQALRRPRQDDQGPARSPAEGR